jgi:hypothetical protein
MTTIEEALAQLEAEWIESIPRHFGKRAESTSPTDQDSQTSKPSTAPSTEADTQNTGETPNGCEAIDPLDAESS